jgi:uncharacterized protein involved in exopolysaccharide biosynthesis
MNQVVDRSLIDPGDFSLADVVRPFARYYWVVLVAVAACLAGPLVFLYYKPAEYTSASLIIVDRGNVDVPLLVDLI